MLVTCMGALGVCTCMYIYAYVQKKHLGRLQSF